MPASWQPADNIPVNLPAAQADDVVFVRPEALRLVADENSSARVTNHAYLGDHIRVTVEHDNARTGSWTVQVSSREAGEVPVGSRVSVSLIDDIALRLPASETGE